MTATAGQSRTARLRDAGGRRPPENGSIISDARMRGAAGGFFSPGIKNHKSCFTTSFGAYAQSSPARPLWLASERRKAACVDNDRTVCPRLRREQGRSCWRMLAQTPCWSPVVASGAVPDALFACHGRADSRLTCGDRAACHLLVAKQEYRRADSPTGKYGARLWPCMSITETTWLLDSLR